MFRSPSDGTAAAPGLTFVSEAGDNSGIYWAGQNQIGVSAAGVLNLLVADTGVTIANALTLGGALDHDGSTAGFYATTPIAKQTGVAVSAAGIHAALVNLGLIAA